ncbi:MAG: class I SAM-dependent DNA methyltransferase, partial [Desulfosarcina sp.]|nr:class I SAM-dependent DNA methyltransferase [Desulfobacterales bacterium]
MVLSWNEIKSRAVTFQNEWKDEKRERAEKDSFYNDFFHVFGISRRRVASFEEAVKKLDNRQGFIDVFWKGVLLIEHKSAGCDLIKAKDQAFDYFSGLTEKELPRYILVSDYQNFELFDLETKENHIFLLEDFHKNVHLFGFIAGYEKKTYKDLEPVNIKASEMMGKLHDALEVSGYTEHDLEQFLVRLLFCLFADDTGIFEKDIFKQFVEEKTKEDGSDVGSQITNLFQVLDTSMDKRQKNLDEHLAGFSYVNGGLFGGSIRIPAFNSKMREALLECCYFDWSQISPAIFGSLFQSVADINKRRELGEHYTSENNIMKTISPLFLDDLWAEFKNCKTSKKKLLDFHKKLEKLKFFDPACGCGNFLVLTYREIRTLELEVLKKLYNTRELHLDVGIMSKIDVDSFYGIEIDEFPAKIAQTALWLMDHKMNLELSEFFGQYFARIPLKKEAKIVHGNSLTIDWAEVVKPSKLSYIIGNPPFVGSKFLAASQRKEMKTVFHGVKGAGVLDYVTAWYKKAAVYIQNTKITCAFVSTNSITQGEQVGILWNDLILKNKAKIHFAHRTFLWNNEARGKAAVHCVIIGFGAFDIKSKRLFDYENIKGEAHENVVENINSYLLSGKDITIAKRGNPIHDVPKMNFGNMPLDGGFLLFTDEEKKEFIKKEPQAKKYIKHFIGAREFLNAGNRWCLWLKDASPKDLKEMPLVMERIKGVKGFREKSIAPTTRQIADTPALFRDRNNSETFIVVPRVSSERRKYIPIGFFDKKSIAGDTCMMISNATLYHFGILTSVMHNCWMRSSFDGCSLADLYDPNTMPAKLTKAHNTLDKAVDKLYR